MMDGDTTCSAQEQIDDVKRALGDESKKRQSSEAGTHSAVA